MDHSQALKHKNLLFAALIDLLRRPVRSVVAILCLAAAIFPIFTAFGISEGVRYQATISVNQGADLYVSRDLYGGNGPISMAGLNNLTAMEGISRAVPRIVGRTYFVDRIVSVVGLDREAMQPLKGLVQGTIPEIPGQVIVGHGIAEEYGISIGLPFTLPANNRKVFKCVGILPPICLWSADILIMHYPDANDFFGMTGMASDFLVYAVPQRMGQIANTLTAGTVPETLRAPALKVEDRQGSVERLRSGFSWKGGVFDVLLLIGAVMAVLVFLVTSGIGLRELQREMALMKAVGWKRGDIIEKVVLEQSVVSVVAVCLAILVAVAWIKGFNGILIAQFYISEVGLLPQVGIPFRVLPSHALACLLFALCVTQIAGQISVCSTAFLAPGESMR